ncbi:hypothetical protein RI129_002036 [Pyrocoelia pectoralis]|uniref:Phospholipid/glycerol acyltransferase domain-containing protein n=1 Tax=Pyrocoelia pectoralis TaxID=417401 RepID=A0AAN7VN29_9COLE
MKISFIQFFFLQYEDTEILYVLKWLLCPIIVTFLLPLMIVVLLYISSFIAHIYKLRWKILAERHGREWASAQRKIAYQWILYGRIYHGYEVRGLENLPSTGPGLIIYYHGAFPTDVYYFFAHVLYYRNRIINSVVDYFLFKLPGFPILTECLKLTIGTKQTCLNILKQGKILMISPGGVYESQFSHQYNLMWKNRIGFAKVAIDAKVPIIPIFTENVREAFRTVSICQKLLFKLYTLTRLPVAPIYGPFPVKMITHVGQPIPYDPELTPEQLQVKVADAINHLIKVNQRIPGSILHAMVDRIPLLQERHKQKGDVK